MKCYINQPLVDSLKPKDKHYEVSDSDLIGFSITVQKTGSVNYYVRYTKVTGGQIKKKICSASEHTAITARAMARSYLDALKEAK